MSAKANLSCPASADDGSRGGGGGGLRGGERRVLGEAAPRRRAPRLHLHAAQGQAVTDREEEDMHLALPVWFGGLGWVGQIRVRRCMLGS